jgi:hypothetical protein
MTPEVDPNSVEIREYGFWPSPDDPQYGLLMCQDEAGKRWTLRGDPEFVRLLAETPKHLRADLQIGANGKSVRDGFRTGIRQAASRGRLGHLWATNRDPPARNPNRGAEIRTRDL